MSRDSYKDFFEEGWHGTPAEITLAKEKQYYIEFFHVPTKKNVKFKAYLTNFTDKFSSDWSSDEVYGRMDPVLTYKGTTRKITLEWDLPASSVAEAKDNMKKCSLLFNMLYPTYSTAARGGVVSAPPLFRVRFANLIQGANGSSGMASAQSSGLVCNIDGFQYSPEIDDGFFEPEGSAGVGTVYPQTLKLSCDLTVLHTHTLGWDEQGKLRDSAANFPYGEKSTDDTSIGGGSSTPAMAAAAASGVTGGGTP